MIKTKDNPKRDALYCRVSTDIQVERGESIDTQKERLLAYTKEHGLNAELYIDAGISAKDINRPQLQRLIGDIKAGKVSSVLVTKLDRISRSVKDIIDLTMLFEEYGVVFKSLTQPFDTSSAMGRAQINLMSLFAQLEREMTSERVGEDMRHRARSGKWNGGVVPFGYMAQAQQIRLNIKAGMSTDEAEQKAKEVCPEDKKLYVHKEEAQLIREIFDKYLDSKSLRAVTLWLNEKKHPSKYGTSWAASSVSRALQSPVYIGKLVYNKRISSKTTGKLKARDREEWIISDATHQPIVEKVKFDAVQSILEKQSVEPTRKLSEYLLSGLLRCGKCGSRMHGYTQRRKDKSFSYYKCYSRQQKGDTVCTVQPVNRPAIEKAIVDTILNLCDKKQLMGLREAHKTFAKEINQNTHPIQTEKRKLEKRIEEIEKKKRILLVRLEDQTIKPYEYKSRILELDQELEQSKLTVYGLETKLNNLEIDCISFETVYEAIKDFKTDWPTVEIIEQKEMLNAIVKSITYTDKTSPLKVELHFLEDATLLPHGHGFMAATNIN